jgi:hypothetical protein
VIQDEFLLISSSLATNYGLPQNEKSYAEILRDSGKVFKLEQKNSLLISQAPELISKSAENQTTLILHFGTTVGWPKAFIRIGKTNFRLSKNPYYFDLPAYASQSKLGRFKSKVKLYFKRVIKNCLLPLRLYKPLLTKEETIFSIVQLLEIADKFFDEILWIQHLFLIGTKTNAEKKIYLQYYQLIMSTVLDMKLEKLTLATPGPDFLNPVNYSMDEVHLSAKGHSEMARVITSWLEGSANKCASNHLTF